MASEPLSAASDRDIHDAHIYDRLVEDEQDVEGLLAYALYKKSERTWLRDFRQRHGRAPVDPELDEFIHTYDSDDLGRLRSDGEQRLLRYANEFVDIQTPEIERAAVNAAIGTHFDHLDTAHSGRHAELMNTLAASRSWLRGILEAGIAQIVVTLATIVLFFSFVAPSIFEILRKIFQDQPPPH